MANPTLSVEIVLDKQAGELSFELLTTYSALGANAAGDVKGALYFQGPTGDIYINSNLSDPTDNPDITLGTTTTFSNAVPLTSSNEIIHGTYKVRFVLDIATGAKAGTYTYNYEGTVLYTVPKIKLTQTIDCFCAKFTSTDTTDYTESVQVAYEHKILYPAQAGEAALITSLKSKTDDRLANGTYVTEVTTTRQWTYGSIKVQDELFGRKSIDVDCEGLCEIKCALSNMYQKWEGLVGKNTLEADALFKRLNQADILVALINMNKNCGKVSSASVWMEKLKLITGDCDCGGCECDDDSIWITSICGSSDSGAAKTYSFFQTGGLLSVGVTEPNTDEFNVTYGLTIDVIKTALMLTIDPTVIDLPSDASFDDLMAEIMDLLATNTSWFAGLTTSGLTGFPTSGTEIQKRQYILDNLGDLIDQVFQPPVARADTSSTPFNTAVSKLVTLNDFFTSDVTVTIVTGPANGTCIVESDGRTLTYTPDTGYDGNDTVTYQIEDQQGNTDTAVWTIIVNPLSGASCAVVVPAYTAEIYSSGTKLAFAISNQTNYGTNIPDQETFIIEIRNAANSILYSYSVDGNSGSAPVTYITPADIGGTWDNVRIQMIAPSHAPNGDSCDTETYETPEPYTLTNITISWFDGTTIPACLGISGSDTEIVKKNKMMSKICAAYTASQTNTSDITTINTTLSTLNDATDISGDISVASPFVLSLLNALLYNNGKVVIDVWVTYPSTVGRDADIITGLPVNSNISEGIFHGRLQGDTDEIAQLKIYGTGGVIRNGISTLPDLAASGNTSLIFHYEYQIEP
jgi:hypothetical protein